MKKIIVIVDTSGSMAEDDKNAVVRYLLSDIGNLREKEEFSDCFFALYGWGEALQKVEDWGNIRFAFSGRSGTGGLEEIGKEEKEYGSLLLISDGNFTEDVKNAFLKLGRDRRTAVISVGMDARRSVLREISTKGEVFAVTELVTAVRSL